VEFGGAKAPKERIRFESGKHLSYNYPTLLGCWKKIGISIKKIGNETEGLV